jgi:hypothetical protein
MYWTANVSASRALSILREYLSWPASNSMAPNGFSNTGEKRAKHRFSSESHSQIEGVKRMAKITCNQGIPSLSRTLGAKGSILPVGLV